MIRIGDLFNIEKGSVQSSKCIEGEFDFITASEEWKKHNEYTHNCEALIFAMGASGSLGRTHYVNQKFVSSDLCYIMTPKQKYTDKLNLRFYYYYFNTFRERIVKATAIGTSKLAISNKNFSDYKIHLIDIEKQSNLIAKIEDIKLYSESLSLEIKFQKKYVSSLRQSILQQAIEGKLVGQDPNDEPASVLLEKIKVEKEKLIAEKKIKKQKELPPIKENEKLFTLPQGWEWCRLSPISFVTKLAGFEYTDHINFKEYEEVPVIRGQNVRKNHLDLRNLLYIDLATSIKLSRCALTKKCLLMTFIGAGIGDVAIFDRPQRFHLAPNVAKIELYDNISCEYMLYYLLSTCGQKEIFKYQKSTAQPSLSMQTIREFAIPLPPLAEQQRIIEKVDKLMALCDELAQEVLSAKKYASQLMEAVLQEAFTSENKELKSDNIIELIQKEPNNPNDLKWAAAARGKLNESTLTNISNAIDELENEDL